MPSTIMGFCFFLRSSRGFSRLTTPKPQQLQTFSGSTLEFEPHFSRVFTTLLLQTALLVFVRQLVISRTFLFITSVMLFLSVVAVRNFFRLTFASSIWPRKCEKAPYRWHRSVHQEVRQAAAANSVLRLQS